MRQFPSKLASQMEKINPSTNHDVLIAAAAQIVSAYVVNRPQESINLPALVSDVYASLASLAQHALKAIAQPHPSVAVEDSIKADYLVCLEDGKQVKMLKRYLKSNYNMTPAEYRARWNLPATYPMVAPNYAVVRSKLAKEIGLGRRGLPVVAKQMVERRVTAR